MTTCYCEDCHAQGRAPYIKDTYTRAWMRECADRDARQKAMRAAEAEQARHAPQPPDQNGWWNQDGAPTA